MENISLFKIFDERNQLWEDFRKRNLTQEFELISISKFTSNRRVFTNGKRVFKVNYVGSNKNEYKKSKLINEYEILIRLNDKINFNPLYKTVEPGWEVLEMKLLKGETLFSLMQHNILNKISLFVLVKSLWMLSKRGICHGDLSLENIILTESKEICFFDYEDSSHTGIINALFCNLFAISPNKVHDFCLMTILNAYFSEESGFSRKLFRVVYWIYTKARNLVNRILIVKRINIKINNISTIGMDNDSPSYEKIAKLTKAWEIASDSDANSPGESIAYYAIDFNNQKFFGERPWELRWLAIKGKIKVENKKFLEMGCNMGLLSIFLKNEGAISCTAVDHDKKILESAKLISEAFQVQDITFLDIDFDVDPGWELKIDGHDIVSCLSVINWVKDKERLLNFLGKHNELLFEGHDSYEMEVVRLKKIGFKNFQILMKSERGRELIWATK